MSNASVAWPPPLLHQAPVFRIIRCLDDVTTVAGSPFSQTSLPSPGPKTSRRATLRMSSDEALRVTLVCTLPLLHFSHSRVAVSSSSAPAFSPARLLAKMPDSVRVTAANSQLSQFLSWLVATTFPFLDFQWVLGCSFVCQQPSEFSSPALTVRAASLPLARRTQNPQPELPSTH